MANNPNAPLWLAPHAILEAVEELVVNDHHNAAVGWTWEEIMGALMRTHQEQEQKEIEEEEPPPRQAMFNAKLLVELDRLVQTGDLKLVGDGGQQPFHYRLSPPSLPRWFRPEMVLDEAGKLDGISTGVWTREQLRDALKQKYQPQKPLPPDFDTVLWTMLSVFRERGHLTITRGPANGGPWHYNRPHAPALAELDPIDIPGHIWCYYLGFKMGVDARFDFDSDLDEEDDASLMANNTPNAPQWFGPRMVLQEIERLFLRDWGKASPGWTCQQIRDSLMLRTHQLEQDGFDLDARLRATLATLTQRGYLILMTKEEEPCYTLSNSPPSFPTWFGREAVLQAVGELDEVNAGGSIWADIYFKLKTIHGDLSQLPPWLDWVLQTTLSVLRQRGQLTWGDSGPEYYTQRHAPATIGIPDDYLLFYYVGYKLGRSFCIDDDVEFINTGDDFVVGIRRRNISANNPGNNDTDETKRLLDSSHDTNEETGLGSSSQTDQARRKEKRRQQRLRYMIWRLFLSSIGHGILFGVSFIPGFGEETIGHHEEKSSKNKWVKWAVMDLIVPIAVMIVMIIVQFFVDLDLEDTSQKTREDEKRVKMNKVVNLATLAGSKLFYVSIKEAPGPKDTLRIIAHVVAFVIDMGGAIYLWRKHSGLDEEMPESSWKTD